MTTRERFHSVMEFRDFDRLPVVEWASWWDKTIERWRSEGLPSEAKERYDISRKVFIDSDGDVHAPAGWFTEAGIQGILPLEAQAGVDLARLRKDNPEQLYIGGYDKMKMPWTGCRVINIFPVSG